MNDGSTQVTAEQREAARQMAMSEGVPPENIVVKYQNCGRGDCPHCPHGPYVWNVTDKGDGSQSWSSLGNLEEYMTDYHYSGGDVGTVEDSVFDTSSAEERMENRGRGELFEDFFGESLSQGENTVEIGGEKVVIERAVQESYHSREEWLFFKGTTDNPERKPHGIKYEKMGDSRGYEYRVLMMNGVDEDGNPKGVKSETMFDGSEAAESYEEAKEYLRAIIAKDLSLMEDTDFDMEDAEEYEESVDAKTRDFGWEQLDDSEMYKLTNGFDVEKDYPEPDYSDPHYDI